MFDDHDICGITERLFKNKYMEQNNIVISAEQFSMLIDMPMFTTLGEVKDDGYSIGLYLGYKVIFVENGILFWCKCQYCGCSLYPERRGEYVVCKKCGAPVL